MTSPYRDRNRVPDKVIEACRTFMKRYHDAPIWKRAYWDFTGKFPPEMCQALRTMAEWYVQP